MSAPSDGSVRLGRAEFLSRIRAGLGVREGRIAPGAPTVHEGLARLSANPVEFEARARTAGFDVRRTNQSALARSIADCLNLWNARTADVSVCDAELAHATDAGMRDAGCRVIDGSDLAALYSADAGVVVAIAGVAESGSVILTSESQSRATHLVPPSLVVLVRSSTILPDFLDLWGTGDGGGGAREMPACLTILSGPSKTADIEGVLITGVHGPGRVIVLVIADA